VVAGVADVGDFGDFGDFGIDQRNLLQFREVASETCSPLPS
jgi:hypothetical protein